MKRWRQWLLALVTCSHGLSCGAPVADWQELTAQGVGRIRLRHSHVLTPADTAPATATAQKLLQWTRDKTWLPMRVEVSDTHPLVIKFKAGSLLMFTPDDIKLPIVWLSLSSKDRRALLEDQGTGALTLAEYPQGQSLDLSWLNP